MSASTISAQPPEKLTGIHVGKSKHSAAGVPAVANSLKHVYGSSGLLRGTSAMLKRQGHRLRDDQKPSHPGLLCRKQRRRAFRMERLRDGPGWAHHPAGGVETGGQPL
jgi:hypothetical protein